jgi:hypothetical protein
MDQSQLKWVVPMTVAPGKRSFPRRLCDGLLAGRRIDRVARNQSFIGRVQIGGKDV